MTVKIVTREEAAKADFVACVPYRAEEGLLLPNNVLARCCRCETRIQLRPDVPNGPRRICLPCALEEAELHGEEDT
ncbi:hypothetical protein [Bradyrhizobium japonicum]|uniref:hypothetical protein n=1 Tax=Bradyrhizobium japonicum TaxID=375 RepID=UPI00209E91AC|nr:hypothetical protein [Bradyrhizobium japonicum]MCP1761917.1 hypothetical protein [Bradyrhizobium japonicum]MCP1793497.1 hypothetical protein [Bradyrhizobium japonicum]MCP1805930.1 hypothetical protein [Bradyrhizobium japonicum]MCP1812333.1 hypothetical protein [Bradyrhizobium japonicum]MCP1873624.1 hypothetical protein [Bradyrhizobium japonicum]